MSKEERKIYQFRAAGALRRTLH